MPKGLKATLGIIIEFIKSFHFDPNSVPTKRVEITIERIGGRIRTTHQSNGQIVIIDHDVMVVKPLKGSASVQPS